LGGGFTDGPGTEEARLPQAAQPDLIYGLNDRPPLGQSVFVAVQHVLAVFVGIVTPPLIISKALNLAPSDEAFLVSMALFISGVGTLLQSRRLGPIGSGLLSIQGTSFVFLGPIIALAKTVMTEGTGQSPQTALGVVFGTCLAAALVPIVISPFIQFANQVITPLVTGVVVTLIGLTLVEVGITSLGGGFEARARGTFGSLENLLWAGIVVALIVALNSSNSERLRMISVVAGLAGGYVVAILAGKIGFSGLREFPWVTIPTPLHYGLGIRLSALIPFSFLYVITAIESIGDLTATSVLTCEPIAGPLYFRRLRGGVMADGVSSMLAAIFNSFPSTTFAQNNGVIQLTGVGSRYIALFVGVMLMLLGLCPVVGGVIQSMPQSVLGGATIIMFGTVAVSGIKILSGVNLDRRSSTIAATSFGLGLGVTFVPDLMQNMPQLVRETFSSGIATGGMCALLLNVVLPGKKA
jgi:xanthine permease XanP